MNINMDMIGSRVDKRLYEEKLYENNQGETIFGND